MHENRKINLKYEISNRFFGLFFSFLFMIIFIYPFIFSNEPSYKYWSLIVSTFEDVTETGRYGISTSMRLRSKSLLMKISRVSSVIEE